MMEAEQRRRPTEESPRVDSNVPTPLTCAMPRELDQKMLRVTMKTHKNEANAVTDGNVQIKMGLNKARSSGEDGTVVESRDHNRTHPDRETFYEATQGELKEANAPENAVKTPNKSNGHHPRVTDKLPSSSIDHGGKYSANVEANGTAKDETHGLKAVTPISLSVSYPKIPQSPKPTKQKSHTDAPIPSSAQRDDGPNVEDFSNLNIIAKPIESKTPQPPSNVVPEDTIPKDKISSNFLDAHPVTGEPAVEVPQIEKNYRFFSLNDSPLKKWMPKVKQMLPMTRSKGKLSRIDVDEGDGLKIATNVHTTTRSKANLSGIDFDEVDGLKIATNMHATAIDNNNFELYIREKLAALICTIPPKGLEKQSSTLQELEMILNEDNQIAPCIVIACASQIRKADIKKKLDSELPHIELYGLRWVVIYDLERSGYLALSTAESNEELAPTAQPGYVATTILDEATDTNNWDRYTSAPLHLFSTLPNDWAMDTPGYASCTLGGFIQVADGIYGLTVAHPLFNAIISSTQASRPHSDQKSKEFVVGNIIACVLSNVSSGNQAGKEEQGSAPLNSDWALIELGEGFNEAQLNEGQLLANLAPVEKENLEVVKDADLEPRTVIIRTGFSSEVKGELGIAKSSLQIGSALFTVMRITLNKPLVPGDSGSFVFLNGKVCGTIIASRDSLKRAYMIPITDTFRSISSEFGGAPVRFPKAKVIQVAKSPSPSPQQKNSSGQVTSHKKKASPLEARDEIPSDLEIPTLANPKLTITPPIPMPEKSYKLNIHDSEDTRISKSGTPLRPKTKAQPMEENIALPQEGFSDLLPLPHALINSSPSMKDKLLKSIVPSVRNPVIDAQRRTSTEYLGSSKKLSVEDVNKVIKKGANEFGRTPLHLISEREHLEVVKLLLEKWADINAADELGRTLLYLASERGHPEVVKLLLEKGANINKAARKDAITPSL